MNAGAPHGRAEVDRSQAMGIVAPAFAACVSLALLTGGCGGGTPPAPAAQSRTVAALTPSVAQAPAPGPTARPAVLPKEPPAGPPLAPLTYDAKGRRDPFTPVSLAKEKASALSVTAVKLVGVIRGRALLALVEAPDGLGYILKPGDTLGDGRVTDVTQNSITFAVTGKAAQAQQVTTVTLKLAAE